MARQGKGKRKVSEDGNSYGKGKEAWGRPRLSKRFKGRFARWVAKKGHGSASGGMAFFHRHPNP